MTSRDPKRSSLVTIIFEAAIKLFNFHHWPTQLTHLIYTDFSVSYRDALEGVYMIQQTSSNLPANVFKIHVNCWTFARRLLEVCWTFAAICYNGVGCLLDVCWKFAKSLLEVCWMFAGSCKHPIRQAPCSFEQYFVSSIFTYRHMFKLSYFTCVKVVLTYFS